jgi:hypothetical protein
MVNKKVDIFLKEFVRKMEDSELQRLGMLYKQNLNGDKRRICEILSSNQEMDKWLAGSVDHEDLWDQVGLVGEYVREEYRYRLGVDEDRRDRKRDRNNDREAVTN